MFCRSGYTVTDFSRGATTGALQVVCSIFLSLVDKKLLDMKTLFCLLGLVLIVEGLPYFAFPDKMKQWLARLLDVPDAHLRGMGLVAMGAGLLITYLCRP